MSEVDERDVPFGDASERSFTAFVEQHELPLRQALTAAFGIDLGREATADAFVHAWQRWDRVSTMDNPVGYLYVVGRNRARRALKRRPTIGVRYVTPLSDATPLFEPALTATLARLSERERAVAVLLHGFGWSMAEVAATLDVSKSTVQSYADRALTKLRAGLGVKP